jgi:hypothetical protein
MALTAAEGRTDHGQTLIQPGEGFGYTKILKILEIIS